MISRRQIIDSHQLRQASRGEQGQQVDEQQVRKRTQVGARLAKTDNKPALHRQPVYDLDGEAEDDYEQEDRSRLERRFRHNKRLAAPNESGALLGDDFGELFSGSENGDQEGDMIDKRPAMREPHQRDKNFKYYKGGSRLRALGEQDSDGGRAREREDSLHHESLLDDAINIHSQSSHDPNDASAASSKSQMVASRQSKTSNGLARRRAEVPSSEDHEQDQDRSRKPRRALPARGRLGPLLHEHQQESSMQAQQRLKAQEIGNSGRAGSGGGASIDVGNFDPYSVYGEEDEEEDVWYSEERLFEDHIQEIVDKWLSIDDEIWAKIICMERNRRIAKAYARSTTITVNGSKDDYLDGTTLGLNSFDNPDRDSKTSYIKRYIGEGVKIRIHHTGDIFVKRLSKTSVFTHHFSLSEIRPNAKHQTRTQPGRTSLSNCLKSSGSSSDVYGLNMTGSELYGIAGPNRQPLVGADLAASGFAARSRNRNLAPNKSGFGMPALKNSSLGASSQSQSTNLALSSSLSSSSTSSSSTSMLASANATLATGADRHKQPNALQAHKVVRLFDMKAFKEALEYESRQAVPNRARLQSMCISIISFVLDDRKLLNLPSWIMIINIVAIDLLSSEIGLVGPYDIGVAPRLPGLARGQGSRFSGQESGPGNLAPMRHKSFDRSYTRNADHFGSNHDEHDYDYNDDLDVVDDRNADIDSFRRPINGVSSKNGLCSNNCNSASGKFMLSQRTFYGDRGQQQQGQLDKGARATDNSMQYFRSELKTDTCDSEFKLASNGSAGHELMGSSSSGFNSNCSLQNDSSAASSNSNIASTSSQNDVNKHDSSSSSSGSETKIASKPAKKGSRFKRMFKKSEPSTSNTGSESVSLGSAGPLTTTRTSEEPCLRGKRAPKLPHGLAASHEHATAEDKCGHTCEPNDDHEPIIMSEPIPIPAPPTSAGCPSGKANLILVSPTGLSPPSVKRNSGLMRKSDTRMQQEFSSIQHIDSTGRCNVLTDTTNVESQQQQQPKKPPKLPTGIPSHAQLAPPATQLHILRYLMSTTKASQASGQATRCGLQHPANNKQQQPKRVLPVGPAPAAPGRRLQRPLPVLPCHQKQQARPVASSLNTAKQPRSDESLYYSGLQARVPNYHHQAQHVPALRQMLPSSPANKSAIDALLTDFKQSAHFRQQQRKNLLTNMRSNSASQLAEQAEANNLPINYYPGHTTAAKYGKQLAGNGDNKYALTPLGSLSTKHYGEHQRLQKDHGQALRRSLDSLNRLSNGSGGGHRPLASFLTHVGGFLKRTKAKGSTPVLVSTEM